MFEEFWIPKVRCMQKSGGSRISLSDGDVNPSVLDENLLPTVYGVWGKVTFSQGVSFCSRGGVWSEGVGVWSERGILVRGGGCLFRWGRCLIRGERQTLSLRWLLLWSVCILLESILVWQYFAKNCMEKKEIGTRGRDTHPDAHPWLANELWSKYYRVITKMAWLAKAGDKACSCLIFSKHIII